jgi:hypothetical protein
MCLLDVRQKFITLLVYNPLDLPDRHIKFIRKRFKADVVKQPPLQDCPVTLREYPFVNQA